ncbi:MAG: TonB-dependent receptor plug domain-containing protein [Betaproteobacteria bacterium]|nr:TonB-dependent receptor plug domain-containing protein [Betaproteobacteria bacterium]
MSTKISTVARKPQTLSDTPAAVFVISQEDIRRSSTNSIPELLRMAPGLSVARIDANKWSVTSRGYSGRFADDLLVMVDDHTVYSPLFAGTFWETLDLPLENVERIEVIRGPSGTIWGANAANGAIHIITKHKYYFCQSCGPRVNHYARGRCQYGQQLTKDLPVDIAGFFNDYSHSASESEVAPATIQILDNRHTQIFGFEIYGQWNAFDRLRFMPSYSHLQVRNRVPLGQEAESGADPKHQFTLRTQLDLVRNVELDAFFRHINKLPGLGVASYQTLDLRLAWKPKSNMEVSVIGQNLLQSHHPEFMPELIQTMPVQIQRGVFGKFTWRF